MTATQSINDLGTMNSWFEDSEERKLVNKCYSLRHRLVEINLGTCYNSYRCDICQITYKIDSSD